MFKSRTLTNPWLVAVGAALAASAGALAQPANDLCTAAQSVAAASVTPGTNVDATSEVFESSCSFEDSLDVWFMFTAGPAGGLHSIDTEGSVDLDDTTLSIYDACGGTELQCDDDSGSGFLSSLVVNLTANQVIKIRVAGYEGAVGAFQLRISAAAGTPANDVCTSATVIAEGSSTNGTNLGASSDVFESSCSFEDQFDVWYSFTAGPAGGTHVFDTETSVGLADTTLSIYDTCGGTELACDDDTGTGLLSRISFTLAANQNVKVRVAGYDSDAGAFVLNVSALVVAPPNDTCTAAQNIAALPATVTGTTDGATSELASTSCALTPTDDLDLWFHITAPATPNGSIAIDTEGSLFDTTLSVFSPCGSAELACDDDGGTGTLSRAVFPATAGTEYWIRLAGWNHTAGSFTLNLNPGPVMLPLTNDTCGTATVLSGVVNAEESSTAALNEGTDALTTCNVADAVGIDNSIWFTFTPGASGGLTGTINPGYDGLAVLYTGGCAGLTEVACWDEPQPYNMAAPDSGSSAVTAGTQYWLVIGDWGNADGGGGNHLNFTIPAAAGGACCSGTTCSAAAGAGACTGPNTLYAGNGTVCNAFGVNNTTPCCLADYNHVGGVAVQDIFDFLAGYFSGSAQADINGGGVSVQDIFDFLAAYFAGCA